MKKLIFFAVLLIIIDSIFLSGSAINEVSDSLRFFNELNLMLKIFLSVIFTLICFQLFFDYTKFFKWSKDIKNEIKEKKKERKRLLKEKEERIKKEKEEEKKRKQKENEEKLINKNKQKERKNKTIKKEEK